MSFKIRLCCDLCHLLEKSERREKGKSKVRIHVSPLNASFVADSAPGVGGLQWLNILIYQSIHNFKLIPFGILEKPVSLLVNMYFWKQVSKCILLWLVIDSLNWGQNILYSLWSEKLYVLFYPHWNRLT